MPRRLGPVALALVSVLALAVGCSKSPPESRPSPPPSPPVDNEKAGQTAAAEVPPPPATTPVATAEQRSVDRLTAPAPMFVGGGVVAGITGNAALAGRYAGPFNTEAYDRIYDNGWKKVAIEPLSTFSVDVDTASYANVRRFLNGGQRPPKDAVRIEELVNYFGYDYPEPAGPHPFSVTGEVGPCPWAPDHRLLLVGLQGRRLDTGQIPPRNLVFLIDVSGSMATPQKLPLVKAALSMLVGHLGERDRVAIVVYAGASGLVLPSTPAGDRSRILAAISDLMPGGSTNGAAGIQLAYDIAKGNLASEGVNRVILATDGDFNVGVTDRGALVRLVEDKRREGIALTVLGFGMGNLKDATLEQLADKGNGNYAYIDSLQEAQKVLVAEAGGTLVTIAKDVKLQLEFNPRHVAAFRLIGYENRVLQHEDFNNDQKDAGEIGAGHSVTALYELVPAGATLPDMPAVNPLRYQRPTEPDGRSDEWLTVKLRYKQPEADTSVPFDMPVRPRSGERMSANLAFASSVAAFGMLLRESEYRGAASFAMVRQLAREHRGQDPHGHRAEFIRLVDLAQSLSLVTTAGR